MINRMAPGISRLTTSGCSSQCRGEASSPPILLLVRSIEFAFELELFPEVPARYIERDE